MRIPFAFFSFQKVCDNLYGKECNIQKAINNANNHLDLNGQPITVSYENIPPQCIVLDEAEASLTGVLPGLLDSIADWINVTIQYVPFRQRRIWSRKLQNGSWTGALADIASGEHVTSAASFISTLDRFEVGR